MCGKRKLSYSVLAFFAICPSGLSTICNFSHLIGKVVHPHDARRQKKAQAASGRRMSKQTPIGWKPDPANAARMTKDQAEGETLELVKTLYDRNWRPVCRSVGGCAE